jgi:hypothetical protein
VGDDDDDDEDDVTDDERSMADLPPAFPRRVGLQQ